jgi:hypothetical protein
MITAADNHAHTSCTYVARQEDAGVGAGRFVATKPSHQSSSCATMTCPGHSLAVTATVTECM